MSCDHDTVRGERMKMELTKEELLAIRSMAEAEVRLLMQLREYAAADRVAALALKAKKAITEVSE